MAQESGKRPKFDASGREGRAVEASPDPHRTFNTVVGEAIRRGRQEHGWTQAMLASRAGLSPNYIARLERGELGPSLFVANQICQALSIDLEELVGTGGQPSRRTSRRRVAG